MKLDLPQGGFKLEKGGVLPRIDVAYETAGRLSPARDNVVLVCHALTGDSHVCGRRRWETSASGWWSDIVRRGGGIDLDRFFVVCANVLGGCMGTTGPSSVDPETGEPWGSRFPEITVADIVDVQRLFMRQLGFGRVHAVIGGSFGGMQALCFAVRHPDFASKVAVIASGPSLTSQALAFDVVGRNAIERDPDFRGGDYYSGRRPAGGLAIARELAHITYLSGEMMKKKFGRRRRKAPEAGGSIFEVESYLRHQGRKFIGRFDANSYLRICGAMDDFDLEKQAGGPLRDAFAPVKARMLVVALDGDWLFLPHQSEALSNGLLAAGKDVSAFLLDAPSGHDSFLIHTEELSHVIDAFFRQEPSRAKAAIDPDTERDYDALEKMIPEGARKVLDVACGDGTLLDFISGRRSETDGTGIDISVPRAVRTLRGAYNVILDDADAGLSSIPDDAFDCAILSESLQVMRRPDRVLDELLRVAPVAIVSFPNFGMWKIPASLLFGGRMPVTQRLPYRWYDTPNIHLCTVNDFLDLCREKGIVVEKTLHLSTLALSRLLNRLGAKNLGSSRVIVKIRRGEPRQPSRQK